ncbi:hypothetical protein MASR2M15_12810 [Anaerolineales bacterium]
MTESSIQAELNQQVKQETKPKGNLFWLASLAIGVVAIVLMVGHIMSAIQFVNSPFLGALVSESLVVTNGQASLEPWSGLSAGLRAGDQIRSVNDALLSEDPFDHHTARANYDRIWANVKIGDSVKVGFNRLDSPEGIAEYCNSSLTDNRCQIEYTVGNFPESDIVSYIVLPFLSALTLLVLGITIAWFRPSRWETILGMQTCFFGSIYLLGIPDIALFYSYIPFWIIGTALLAGNFFTIGIVFPMQLRLIYRFPWIRFIPMVGMAIFSIFMMFEFFAPASPWEQINVSYYGNMMVILSLACMGLFILLIHRPRAYNLRVRNQANVILIGLGLMLVPLLIWQVNRMFSLLGQNNLLVNFESITPLFILPIIGVTYALVEYRYFNTDQIISRGITYTILLMTLVMGYFLLVFGTSLFIQRQIEANHALLIALTIFLVAIGFLPLRNRLQEKIDSLYYRTRRSYQFLVEDFSKRLTTLVSYNDIIREFKKLLDDTVAPSNVFVFLYDGQRDEFSARDTDIRFNEKNGLIKLLKNTDSLISLDPSQPWPTDLWADRARLTILRTQVIAGLRGTDRFNGFVVIGAPRSGEISYSFEELRFIDSLISQLSIASERTQVILSLQKRVRELDVLSQVGQAVNFTIEFDDLLELISAQTSRLIDTACFYIILYDEPTKQVYYAFFLENDDRKVEKENIRWRLSNDLISDIIENGRGVRVLDYTQELARRNVHNQPESRQLKAWMGVPLVAGPRTLGILAVGETGNSEGFTQEQFKVLNDIGALAATSLDKARLFSETNIRAKQLEVLNDISRQLVTAELDPEKLLTLIMNSAVEMLNAEAGSLFLTTEDGRGDLEFRVVIGGAGDALIGTRIPRGEGIVGSVAENAESMIVNDAANDPRHGEEVADTFVTKSILATPLIAKDGTIGVIEVLNKRDGTFFNEEDMNLLLTFGGQAAIALENARLFRMTNMQLNQRVRELEVLENTDHELGRARDVNEVGAITIRAAIENCKAQAGFLGLILDSTPPKIHIVALEGYSEDEYPKDANGLIWPADRGIISRVIRSKQPDFVTDTRIDPDYVPTLKGGISQITIPIVDGTAVKAILVLETNEHPPFRLDEWLFVQRLTEHASIALENAQLYSKLIEANESKSEFMGFAAHELKNPLSSIKGYADLILSGMGGEVPEQQASFLDTIRSNANRMHLIIEDLRDAARLEANTLKVDLKAITLDEVIEESIRPFEKDLVEKNQTVDVLIDEDLPLILGDKARLIQVFTNLISNAHKYSPKDTHIKVLAEAKPRYEDSKVKIRQAVVHIQIKDQGIGLSENDLSRLFNERYFRSENPKAQAEKGTGLGMMITQGIIQQHGGKIWAESELNVGTTFNIILLIANEENTPKEKTTDTKTELASD